MYDGPVIKPLAGGLQPQTNNPFVKPSTHPGASVSNGMNGMMASAWVSLGLAEIGRYLRLVKIGMDKTLDTTFWVPKPFVVDRQCVIDNGCQRQVLVFDAKREYDLNGVTTTGRGFQRQGGGIEKCERGMPHSNSKLTTMIRIHIFWCLKKD